jgi:hypothetical protein
MALNTFNLNLNDEIIFDSGATDHMFCNKKFFTNLDLIKNIKYVLVANGTKVQIDGIGNYSTFSKEIKNVIYVKSLSTNLIFIKKLTQELNYNVIFSSSNITLQDWVTMKRIGEGCQKNNLYVFKPKMLNLCASTKTNNFEL